METTKASNGDMDAVRRSSSAVSAGMSVGCASAFIMTVARESSGLLASSSEAMADARAPAGEATAASMGSGGGRGFSRRLCAG